jgi:tellurite resistance protein TerC
MNVPLWVWIVVILGIIVIFTVSLVFGRKAHLITVGEAARWVAGYIGLAVLFGLGIWLISGSDYAGQFFAGYITEYALSVDNLFVFAIILTSFRVPRELQGKVVLIGIAIALVLRGGLIAAGSALIHSFSWVFYLFGIFLVITAINLARNKEESDTEEPKTVTLLRRVMPISDGYVGGRYLVRQAGRRMATPLLAVILALGTTDIVFALDSIPAIFGLTKEAFLVFTANAFALLGLSELYFVLGALLDRLRYLGKGLSLILLFIGVKLILEALAENSLPFLAGGEPISWAPEISPAMSLVVVGSILAVTVIASLVASRLDRSRALAPTTTLDATPGNPPEPGPAAAPEQRSDEAMRPASDSPPEPGPAAAPEPGPAAAPEHTSGGAPEHTSDAARDRTSHGAPGSVHRHTEPTDQQLP